MNLDYIPCFCLRYIVCRRLVKLRALIKKIDQQIRETQGNMKGRIEEWRGIIGMASSYKKIRGFVEESDIWTVETVEELGEVQVNFPVNVYIISLSPAGL